MPRRWLCRAAVVLAPQICQSVDMCVGLLPEPLQVPRVRARHTFSVKGPMVKVPQCQARWSWSQSPPRQWVDVEPAAS